MQAGDLPEGLHHGPQEAQLCQQEGKQLKVLQLMHERSCMSAFEQASIHPNVCTVLQVCRVQLSNGIKVIAYIPGVGVELQCPSICPV